MARDKLTEYSATASENTVCGDVNIAENSALPSDMNNAVREIMSHQKEAFGSGTPLLVDQTNNRLGVGVASPQSLTHFKGTSSGQNVLHLDNSAGSGHGDTNNNVRVVAGNNGYWANLVIAAHSLEFKVQGGSTGITAESDGDLSIADGDLVIGTSGHGIDFSATSDASGATSELLDDYEEGTWTPVLTTSSGTPATYGAQQIGKYVKIGDLVHIYFDIAINQINNSNTTLVSGHPFNSVNNDALAVSFFSTLAVSPVFVSFQCVGSQGFMAVGLTSAGTNISNGMGIFGNSTRIIASGTYRTA